MKFLANRYNGLGNRYSHEGDTRRAIESYRKAIRWAPRWSSPWYNLGLLFKYRHDWRESLAHNRRAVELDAGSEAAWWNLGIAATALGEWAEARRAWRAFGIEVPDGEGPPRMDLGPVPIRLNPEGDGEVVWCRRIDPARAIIENVPMPESQHRCGDLLLHDGAQEGTRVWNGVEVPVFNELVVLESSPNGTFVVTIDGLGAGEAETLVERAAESDLTAEDWSANIRWICDACSKGRVDAEHRHERKEDGPREIAFAAPSEARVRGFVRAMVDAIPGAELVSIECVLPALPVH